MQSLDINRPGMPDLQFVLMVAALCTSELPTLNVPDELRRKVFDGCWALTSSDPPPTDRAARVLDLRNGTDLTLEALVATIREIFSAAGITMLTWDHPPSEPTRPSTPEALPLIERLQRLYPERSDEPLPPASA
jgi:hypothetical protein